MGLEGGHNSFTRTAIPARRRPSSDWNRTLLESWPGCIQNAFLGQGPWGKSVRSFRYGHWAFRCFAQRDTGYPEYGRFLLDAARVRHDDARCSLEAEHFDVPEGIGCGQRFEE